MVSVATAINRFEKQSDGVRFRNWLSRITRNANLKALTRQPRDRASRVSEPLNVLSEVPADPETDALINLKYRRAVLHRAAGSRIRTDQSLELQST